MKHNSFKMLSKVQVSYMWIEELHIWKKAMKTNDIVLMQFIQMEHFLTSQFVLRIWAEDWAMPPSKL